MSYFKYKNSKIYYDKFGTGKPLVIIHGDTASSKMIMSEAKYYAKYYQVIILDLIGQGRSERVENLPIDYWYANGHVVVELCRFLSLKDVNLLGASGGALTALNAVLIEPGLFDKIIADSFIGESISIKDALTIADEREHSKKNLSCKNFWSMMHGDDWQKVIDQSTKMLVEFSQTKGNFFNKELEEILNPVLFTGSRCDELIPQLEDILLNIHCKIKNSKLIIFDNGNHPAMISCKSEFRQKVIDFLNENN